MSLEDELERMQKELEEAQEREAEEAKAEPEVEAAAEEPEPTSSPEEKEDAEEVEEKTDEETAEPEPEEKTEEAVTEPEPTEAPLDNSGMARLRREAAAAKRRAEMAEAKLAEKQAAPVAEEFTEVAEKNPLLEKLARKDAIEEAVKEFSMFEEKTKAKHPEYQQVASEYVNLLAQAIKVQNPRLTAVEISERARDQLLTRAGQLLNEGYENPVEELMHEAKEMGLGQKKSTPAKEVDEPKVDMAKVAANRKRSAGTVAAPGKTEGQLNATSLVTMTLDDFRKIPKSEVVAALSRLG